MRTRRIDVYHLNEAEKELLQWYRPRMLFPEEEWT
jgi:hypothetical protein